MGILQRFSDIMSSNINALLDKCENPAKMVDQTLIKLRNDLAVVRKETAAVMADEANAKRKLDECDANIKKAYTAAQNALRAGNEDDARVIIARKQKLEETRVSLQTTYDANHASAVKMRQMHDKLTQDIEDLESRKDAIKAKVATAKAQEHMNKMTAGVNTSASLAAFDRMEAKADKMLDQATAEAELNAGSNTAGDLIDKYATGGNATVEDELARMKAELS